MMAYQNPVPVHETHTHATPERSDGSRGKVLAFVPDPLLDTDEAAAVMKIHPKTLQKLARRGSIHGIRVGKLWRFRASHIQDWIEKQ
jgi:excisionase family DNA binding protein